MKKKTLNNLREFSEWFTSLEDEHDCFMTTDGFIAPMKYPCQVKYNITSIKNGKHNKTCKYSIHYGMD